MNNFGTYYFTDATGEKFEISFEEIMFQALVNDGSKIIKIRNIKISGGTHS